VTVHVIPPHVANRSSIKRCQPSLRPATFVFLVLADAASVLSRKNPEGAVKAFRQAFGDSRDVELVVKINHPESDRAGVAALQRAARGASIRVIDGTSSRDQIDGYLNRCDTLVSLHRSEGFGLPCAEAMALGKPVIATDYSGSTDFLDEETGFPIPYRIVQLPQPIGPYEKGAIWAEPDLDAAAAAMRKVFEDREEGRKRGVAAAARIEERYGRAATAERLKKRLGHLRSRLLRR
jgi:glycosyltransferase involved in cell wall biosynthesis